MNMARRDARRQPAVLAWRLWVILWLRGTSGTDCRGVACGWHGGNGEQLRGCVQPEMRAQGVEDPKRLCPRRRDAEPCVTTPRDAMRQAAGIFKFRLGFSATPEIEGDLIDRGQVCRPNSQNRGPF
jgi:hypothetical protein